MPEAVTLLMPTYNRARALEAVWPSYAHIPELAAIVIVDDGSTDNTQEVVDRLRRSTRAPVTYIRHDRRRGAPAARRSALAEARTPWVLFGEDDVWLGDGYCATLLADAAATRAVAIGGRLITARVPGEFSADLLIDDANSDVSTDVFDPQMLDADYTRRPPHPVPVPFLHALALIRRDALERVSFDERFASGNGWREETDFYLGLVHNGGIVMFTPNAVCYHLRGPVSATGGQRIPRWRVEYYAWRNTLKLVRKHWQLLSTRYGFRGTPLAWTTGFMFRRERAQLARWRAGHRSGFRP